MQVRENHIYNKLFTKEKIIAYLQNRLGSEERSAFEAHLKDDPFLEDAVEGYKMMPAADVHAFVDAICKDLDLITDKSRKRFISLQTRPMAIAALFLIFIGVSWFAVWFMNKSAADQQIAQAEKRSDETNSTPESFVPADTNNTLNAVQQNVSGDNSLLKNEKATSDNNDYRKEEEISADKQIGRDITLQSETKEPDLAKTESFTIKSTEESITEDNKTEDVESPVITDELANIPAAADDYKADEAVVVDKASVKKDKVSKNADKDITLSGVSANTSSFDYMVGEPVYLTADEMPHYMGGESSMTAFITGNLHVSDSTMGFSSQEVIVKFIVDKNGKVKNPEIVLGINEEINAQVLRVISNMPDWIPGKQNGEAVNVAVTLPVKIDY